MRKATVHHITLFPLTIPLRFGIRDADSQRDVSAPLIVAVEFTNGTVGYGETRPIANNETPQGRTRNRRIDILIEPQIE